MLPKNFKDIVAEVEHTGIYQTLAMLLFILIFIALLFVVFSRPKKYYEKEESLPLDEDFNIHS